MKIKLIKFPHKYTSEIFQSLDIKFAFCKKVSEDTYEQLHTDIKCRDFLGDCVWSRETKKSVSIYGFNFDANETHIDTDCLRMSLTFPDKGSKSYFKKNVEFLKVIEDTAKTSNIKILTTDTPLTYIIEADSIWQSAVWKISLYTFYLKLISYKDTASAEDPEGGYLKVLLSDNNEEKLLNQVHNMKEILAKDINTAHNYSGFVSIIKNQNKEMNKLLLG